MLTSVPLTKRLIFIEGKHIFVPTTEALSSSWRNGNPMEFLRGVWNSFLSKNTTTVRRFAYMSTITSIVVGVASSDNWPENKVQIVEGGVGETFVAIQFTTARATGYPFCKSIAW